MALACLFQQLKHHALGPKLDLTALVVDHAHRPDSAKEARTVSEWLEKLGIEAKVLKIRWRSGQEPSQTANFESIARKARYRTLAYACLDLEIKALFLGHHLFDQVETILFRLARGQSVASLGLRGMRSVNNIPCCEDILGAGNGFDASPVSKLLGMRFPPNKAVQSLEDSSLGTFVRQRDPLSDSILVSHGGIKIYRPLLSFPKPRLIATCEANVVPFVTDPSNFDLKTTERNAIRWLLSNNKLPMALRPDSVLLLSAASARQEEARNNKLVELMMDTQLVRLDLRSGRLIVRVPTGVGNVYNASEKEAAYYVHRLVGLVSPRQDYSKDFSIFFPIARWMFPELREAETSALDKPLDLHSCTVHNVLIEHFRDHSGRLWQFTRRPFTSYQKPFKTFIPAPEYSKSTDKHWSKWVPWDERYFFRIRTQDPEDVKHFKVRALDESDLQDLTGKSSHLSPILQKYVRNTLQEAAPGKLRFTLPVLVKGKEVRAFPTLGIAIPPKTCLHGVRGIKVLSDELQWEARYRDITEALQYLKNPLSNIGVPRRVSK